MPWHLKKVAALISFLFVFVAYAEKNPNILFIMADDLGWMDLACQGNKLVETPHLDRLAKQGMRFTSAYAAAPVCSPTRGTCLTGRHDFRYGITHANRGHLPAQEITLARVLKSQGYITGHFGKWHLVECYFG